MKDDIVSKNRLRSWIATAMSAGGWVFCIALLGASLALGGGGAIAWILFNAEFLFAFSILGSALLGGIGGLLLIQRLDEAARRLRQPDQTQAA